MARLSSYPSILASDPDGINPDAASREHFTSCTDVEKFTIDYNCVQYHLNSYYSHLSQFLEGFIYMLILFLAS